ncbi:MAG: DsbA family protein [Parvibaculaceae bacterium]
MEQNKRNLVIGAAALLAVVLIVIGYLNSGSSPNPASANGAESNEAADALSVEGPLGDIAMGSPDAPVTVYEYASLTCNHCAAFHLQSLPPIKEKYIDTGKVRWVIRAFPFDPAATAAVMMARCAGEDRYYKFLDVLFEQQPQWAFQGNPGENLENIAKQGGFSSEAYNACIQNEEIFDHVRAVQTRAQEVHGVRSTPTFFVNGEKVEGAVPFETFEEVLLKHLPES